MRVCWSDLTVPVWAPVVVTAESIERRLKSAWRKVIRSFLAHGDGSIPHEMGAGVAVLRKRLELVDCLIDLRLAAQSGFHHPTPGTFDVANHVLYPTCKRDRAMP